MGKAQTASCPRSGQQTTSRGLGLALLVLLTTCNNPFYPVGPGGGSRSSWPQSAGLYIKNAGRWQLVTDASLNPVDDYGYLSRVAAYMSAGGREGDYLMMVGNSFQENSVVFQGNTIPAWKRTLMIRGLNGMKTIGLGTGASNSLLTILSNNTITLSENITLQGNISSFPLVRINTSPGFPGTLVMEENAVITGHTNPGNNGGGVYVDGGTFTMNGGIIEGNRATNGGWGGVRVAGSSSSFYMPGGTIIGNTADVLDDSLCVQAGAIAKYGAPPAVGSDIITDPLSTGIDDPLTGHS